LNDFVFLGIMILFGVPFFSAPAVAGERAKFDEETPAQKALLDAWEGGMYAFGAGTVGHLGVQSALNDRRLSNAVVADFTELQAAIQPSAPSAGSAPQISAENRALLAEWQGRMEERLAGSKKQLEAALEHAKKESASPDKAKGVAAALEELERLQGSVRSLRNFSTLSPTTLVLGRRVEEAKIADLEGRIELAFGRGPVRSLKYWGKLIPSAAIGVAGASAGLVYMGGSLNRWVHELRGGSASLGEMDSAVAGSHAELAKREAVPTAAAGEQPACEGEGCNKPAAAPAE
jgi:hypothetical protein